MRVNYKLILMGLIPMLIYIYSSYTYISRMENEQLDEKYLEVSRNIRSELKTLIDEKKEAILLLSLAVSENDKIKQMLLSKKDKINLESFSSKLKKYSSLHNVWFQVLSSDGISLYRSWTNTHGDSVVAVRDDIVKIIKKPQVISPISVGKFDMTFKSIVPIFSNKEFIGIIETIAKFNSISRKMQQFGCENILLVDKKYKKQLSQIKNRIFIDDYYVASQNITTSFLSTIEKNLNKYLHIHNYFIADDRLFTLYNIYDINGKKMAYFILSKSLKNIDISEIQNQKITLIAIFFLIYICIAGIFYYTYVVNYKRFVEKHQKDLEKNVAVKTKELKRKSEALKYQAEHDTLTNLPNRLLFLDRLKQALKYAKREKKTVTVLFLDLDRFKEVNDTYGHEIGDKLLQEVTQRLTKDRREEDTIARLGGDEFTLLVQNIDENGIVYLVNHIITSIQKPFFINGIEIHTSFSIGISSYPKDGITYEELLRNADIAMYQAKDQGKNKYCFYDTEMTKLAFERLALEKELRRALANEEFEAYFQPKIDAKHHKVVGLEALIRWKHPTKGMIFPDKFIPFAEEIGLIGEIDNLMMKISMRQVLQWQEQGMGCGKISINLSARQLASKNYIEELKETIAIIGLETKFIEIEITETHIMEDPNYAMEILNKIRDLGISIAIDDFGTGYSSLAYLKKLPVSKLKIDRSFVMDLPKDSDDVVLVKTIISLAKNLGLEVIAEGVEEKEQVDFLVEQGCYEIQGYYFSKPLSKEDCEKFLITF